MAEFKLPDDFSKLHPEEQEKWLLRKKIDKERKIKEKLEDTMREQKQNSKLERELGEEKKPKRIKMMTSRERAEKESRDADEFQAKQRGGGEKEKGAHGQLSWRRDPAAARSPDSDTIPAQ